MRRIVHPHNVEHNIYDYPKYYDVIYYPELYVQHFATPDTCALWLTRDLTVHLSSCNKCLERTQNSPDLEIYVQWVDPFFALTLRLERYYYQHSNPKNRRKNI